MKPLACPFWYLVHVAQQTLPVIRAPGLELPRNEPINVGGNGGSACEAQPCPSQETGIPGVPEHEQMREATLEPIQAQSLDFLSPLSQLPTSLSRTVLHLLAEILLLGNTHLRDNL